MFTQPPPPVTCYISGERHWAEWIQGKQGGTSAPHDVPDVASDFAAFEYSLSHLKRLEARHGLLTRFSPEGEWSKARKASSYIGGIRSPQYVGNKDYRTALRDPGNYVYGLILRISSPQYFDALHYSDCTLGDILEATLGLAWQMHIDEVTVPYLTASTSREYFLVIERAVLACEQVLKHTAAMGVWTHSRVLARWFTPEDRSPILLSEVQMSLMT
jgi:hypothetical protein